MKFAGVTAVLAASVAMVSAQSNNNQSICDKYTTALLKTNNATNQKTVLTLVVNTALIGNYSNATGPAKNEVTGILNNGTYNGTQVSLLKYFNGDLKSTNVDGKPASVNFLDGGGAAPLLENMPAFANASDSNQYKLVSHLYQLFGSLLGCSMQTEDGPFMTYQGNPSMSSVHRFMNLDATENGYFIQEVGKSATSFGVSMADATAVGNALNSMFNYKCLEPAALVQGAEEASQSTCLDPSCPTKENSSCAQTGDSFGSGTNGTEPAEASDSDRNQGSSGSSGNGGGDGSTSMYVNAAGALALAVAGAIAVAL